MPRGALTRSCTPTLDSTVVCLTPANVAADLEVSLSLNGQQYATSAAREFSSLPSAALAGDAAAQAQLLRGIRYRFYESPAIHSLQPLAGPSAGGTLLVLTGEALDGNVLHDGARSVRRALRELNLVSPRPAHVWPGLILALKTFPAHVWQARCRIGDGAVVPATVWDGQRIECRTPPAFAGRAAVQVSLNGGADWSVNRSNVPFVQHEYECDPSATIEGCLRDGDSCGWCNSSGGGGQCLPCAETETADSHGATSLRVARCALGPRAPHQCSEWRHVTAVRDHETAAPGGANVENEVEYQRVAYYRFAPPHPHAVLRIFRTHSLQVNWYVRRGAVPPIDASWLAPSANPL